MHKYVVTHLHAIMYSSYIHSLLQPLNNHIAVYIASKVYNLVIFTNFVTHDFKVPCPKLKAAAV